MGVEPNVLGWIQRLAFRRSGERHRRAQARSASMHRWGRPVRVPCVQDLAHPIIAVEFRGLRAFSPYQRWSALISGSRSLPISDRWWTLMNA